MRVAKRIGWILTGFLIGVLATSSVGHVRAQQGAKKPDRLRVTEEFHVPDRSPFEFLFDTKSNGCWLLSPSNAIAVAPVSACQ